MEYQFGQEIFTPEDTANAGLIPDDRPYAGWAYAKTALSAVRPTADPARDIFDSIGIQLGIVGPASLAENTQKFIHKSEGLAIPQGWDNQLSNEIGMALTYKRGSLRRFGHASSGAIDHDLALYFVSAVGNVLTHVGGGARWRSGVGLVSDPTSMALGWHLFTELETRAVVRNIFLDGNSWSESHSVRKRPLVGHFAAGFEYLFIDVALDK